MNRRMEEWPCEKCSHFLRDHTRLDEVGYKVFMKYMRPADYNEPYCYKCSKENWCSFVPMSNLQYLENLSETQLNLFEI